EGQAVGTQPGNAQPARSSAFLRGSLVSTTGSEGTPLPTSRMATWVVSPSGPGPVSVNATVLPLGGKTKNAFTTKDRSGGVLPGKGRPKNSASSFALLKPGSRLGREIRRRPLPSACTR